MSCGCPPPVHALLSRRCAMPLADRLRGVRGCSPSRRNARVCLCVKENATNSSLTRAYSAPPACADAALPGALCRRISVQVHHHWRYRGGQVVPATAIHRQTFPARPRPHNRCAPVCPLPARTLQQPAGAASGAALVLGRTGAPEDGGLQTDFGMGVTGKGAGGRRARVSFVQATRSTGAALGAGLGVCGSASVARQRWLQAGRQAGTDA